MGTALTQVAKRLSVSETELQSIVLNTVMPNGGRGVTNEQFVSFIAVANEYKLNPLVKEIYAFPATGGGIQPIVSIDGWLRIINSHPDFDGMMHEDILDQNGNITAIKCSIFKKNTKHPIVVTEYMAECARQTEPWKKWPARMLRHKATIQCGRYAFGISGIIDPDEAERFAEAGAISTTEKEVKAEVVKDFYPDDLFETNFPLWKRVIESGKKTAQDVINTVSTTYQLKEEQLQQIINAEQPEEAQYANA